MKRPDRWIIAFALVLLVAGTGRDALNRWIETTDLPPLISESSIEVLDRNGTALRIYTVADGRWRLGASPAQVDPGYLNMLIAYEDKRFYHHSGVDTQAMARAFWQALRHGQLVSGGSTLSMQVARLMENSGTGRWRGKLRQIRLALALERRLTKDQILGLYLTHAPYGGNLEGVRAASLAWFGKEPKRLTPAESALLVALPQSPETRRPDRHHARAADARNRVLARLQKAGILTAETVAAALTEPVPARRRAFPALAAHLADQALAQSPGLVQHYLTLDATLQRQLELLAQERAPQFAPGVSMAIIVADHQTGEILASVGSAGYSDAPGRQGFVDMTRAVRSPGSTLKPFVYALAFDRGLAHPQTLIDDRPVAFGTYAPQNFDGAYRGQLPVEKALQLSLNIPVILLMEEVGPAHLINVMHRSDTDPILPGNSPAGLAIALGGLGVSLSDMVQLYAMLANGGRARPLSWQRDAVRPQGDQVLSPVSAWQVTDILSKIPPPQGAAPRQLAYKTGTSYGHRDTWALGYDGRHVAGVWIGRPDGTPVPGAFGAQVAAPILFDVFQRLKDKSDPLPPPPPQTLLLATAQLPQPLRRFSGRDAVFEPAPDAPKLIFPPDGARLPLDAGALPVKVRDGTPPFTWLADGVPILTGIHRRETALTGMSRGYSTLAVIDAAGRASRVTVRLD